MIKAWQRMNISEAEYQENIATWAAPVYVLGVTFSGYRVHIPHQGVTWLPVGQCPGLGKLRPGEFGEVYIPGWLVKDKKLKPTRWVKKREV